MSSCDWRIAGAVVSHWGCVRWAARALATWWTRCPARRLSPGRGRSARLPTLLSVVGVSIVLACCLASVISIRVHAWGCVSTPSIRIDCCRHPFLPVLSLSPKPLVPFGCRSWVLVVTKCPVSVLAPVAVASRWCLPYASVSWGIGACFGWVPVPLWGSGATTAGGSAVCIAGLCALGQADSCLAGDCLTWVCLASCSTKGWAASAQPCTLPLLSGDVLRQWTVFTLTSALFDCC